MEYHMYRCYRGLVCIIVVCCVAVAFSLVVSVAAEAEDVPLSPLDVSVLKADGSILNSIVNNPRQMMRTYLLEEIQAAGRQWQKRYESLKTVEHITEYQGRLRELFRERLGTMWHRTPLQPRITKTLSLGTPGRDAYRIELVIFESVPQFYVTGAVFLPDAERFAPPYPALLIPCGHAHEAKAYPVYQQVAALAATHGFVAFLVDPIDLGERSQRLGVDGKPLARSVPAHNIIGAGSILLGRNAATFEVWDLIRALDYLESRYDVDASRGFGVAGHSGGGTQTSYLMALDERVAVAAPVCYLCSLYGKLPINPGPQDAEQNIWGQLAFGMDHVDYCLMRAPKPTLIEATTKDFFPVEDTWQAFRYAKRLYDRFGFAEKVSMIEHDGGHGWQKSLREATVRWMLRWLVGRDELITEDKAMLIAAPQQLLATPHGEVLRLNDARSAFDLNRDLNVALAKQRDKLRADVTDADSLRATIRQLIGVRPLDEIPVPGMTVPTPFQFPDELNKIGLREIVASAEQCVWLVENERLALPAVSLRPHGTPKGVTILLADRGKTVDVILNTFMQSGHVVIAVDLRGLGETQNVGPKYFAHQLFGTDGSDFYLAYLLGRSYVGMRTEDLLAIARWINMAYPDIPIAINANGEVTGLVALHAAAIEPQLFTGGITLAAPLRTWQDVVEQGDSPYPITNLVHGALQHYDIPDLVQLISMMLPFGY